MAFVGVPWAVENGARLTAEVLRTGLNVATSDAQGVALPGDLKVTATATPSRSVDIAGGGILIRNRQQPGESYVGAARGVTNVSDFGSTTGARSDLIVARVVDPDFSPWQASDIPDPVNGPYLGPHVIKGVAPGTTRADQVVTYSAEAVARVDWPSGSTNSTNITPGMVTDLRRLARPRTDRQVAMWGPTPEVPMNNTSGAVWPDYSPAVSVPPWATQAYVIATLSSVGQRDGASQGLFAVVLGGLRSANIQWDLDAPQTGGSRHTLVVGGGFLDVRGRAGTSVTVQLEARKTFPELSPGHLVTVDGTQVLYDVQFYERLV